MSNLRRGLLLLLVFLAAALLTLWVLLASSWRIS
jgi:hypothetical protein